MFVYVLPSKGMSFKHVERMRNDRCGSIAVFLFLYRNGQSVIQCCHGGDFTKTKKSNPSLMIS